jgi:hypothetical protein
MRTSFWITVTAASLALLGCAEDGTRKPTTNTTKPSSNTTANDADGRTTVSKPAVGGGNTPATSATPAPGTTTDRTTTDTDTPRPDNTAVNKRDQDPDAVLPTDQGNNAEDLRISSEIRQRINRNKEISFNGKNVKTPTLGGKVTLRGPVASEAEKKMIEDIAEDVAKGAENVTSELEIAP